MVNSGWRFHATSNLECSFQKSKNGVIAFFFFQFTLPESQNLECTYLFLLSHENPSLKLFLKALGYSSLIMYFFQANHHFHAPLSVSTRGRHMLPSHVPNFPQQVTVEVPEPWTWLVDVLSSAAPIFFSFHVFQCPFLRDECICIISPEFRESVVASSKGRNIDKP